MNVNVDYSTPGAAMGLAFGVFDVAAGGGSRRRRTEKGARLGTVVLPF